MQTKSAYLHFDLPVSTQSALKVCSDLREVARHAFYPFIYTKLPHTKIGRNSQGVIFKKEKVRQIAVAAHMDRDIYAYYTHQLNELYEQALRKLELDNVVLAFRSLGKNNIHFAQEAFTEISKAGACNAVGIDISGFFDNLDHQCLKEKWKVLLGKNHLPPDHYNVYKSITRYAKVEKTSLYNNLGISIHNPKRTNPVRLCEPSEFRQVVRNGGLIERNELTKGIPQGISISCVLSNIYMLDFDEFANKWMQSLNGSYRRYCDDMLFIFPATQDAEIVNVVSAQLTVLGLQLNTGKTEERKFNVTGNRLKSDKPLQYLGFTFDGQQILIRSATLSRQMTRMRKAVKLAKASMRKRNRAREERHLPLQKLYRRSLYKRFSYLGKGKFISYGLNSAKIMQSGSIRKQIKPLWKKLLREIQNEFK
jgi:RNA-directed DNA polymerase